MRSQYEALARILTETGDDDAIADRLRFLLIAYDLHGTGLAEAKPIMRAGSVYPKTDT